jgi:hypothetical protein
MEVQHTKGNVSNGAVLLRRSTVQITFEYPDNAKATPESLAFLDR